VINYFNICFKEIFPKAIMHKYRFGQAHCIDLHNRILKKFILYFSEIYSIFYEIEKFNEFPQILNQQTKFRNRKQFGGGAGHGHSDGSSPRSGVHAWRQR
jgi:hypothetical protein